MASTSQAPEDGSVHQQASPFLRIAAELRNRIYEEAFSTTVILTPKSTTSLDSGYGIILACKQTCDEATGLYYSSHTFRFRGAQGDPFKIKDRCIDWLAAIGSKHREMLKRVEIDTASARHTSHMVFPADTHGRQMISLDSLGGGAVMAAIMIEQVRGTRSVRSDVVFVSIYSPLGWHETGKPSVVFTATPKETLKEHNETFRASESAPMSQHIWY